MSHEQFEELCALAATAQLSEDEEQRLSAHLETCPSCRAACDEFSSILQAMPTAGAAILDRGVVRQVESNGFRERFLARARGEGRRFSEDAEKGTTEKHRAFPFWVPAYQLMAAGVILAIVCGVVGYQFLRNRENGTKRSADARPSLVSDARPSGTGSDELSRQVRELESANDKSRETTATLQAQNGALLGRLDALGKQFAASEASRQSLERTVSRLMETNASLTSQLDENAQLLAQTKGELEKTRSDRMATDAEVAAERAEVNQLSEQVRLQGTSLDQDRQLLVAGRDITDLMGARNLHIIDVHDADGSGTDKKSFGRVFYTEGKSLIFYAFDLDDKKVENAKYTFEAWGERLGQPASVKSLGVLFSDDKGQRRWVLKVDKPEQLAEIDSVFVTLEPREGTSDKPRGHRILYAFLGGQPNHP